MIIVCNSCPAQYSVPDARVRGKLVRITCKHCAAAIVVDGRQMAAEAPKAASALSLPLPAPDSSELREDDVTLIARPKGASAFSVHDEATVIGQIPAEALAVERMLSQRTMPPPAHLSSHTGVPTPAPVAPATYPSQPAPQQSPRALPELPEHPDDETRQASPQAFVRSEPPPAAPAPTPPAPAPPKMASKPVVRDDRTLVSSSLEAPIAQAATPSRLRYAVLALVVVGLGLLWVVTRTLR